jgi:hypothetical protein
MFVPLPLLIVAAFAFAVLAVLAFRPRGRRDDLIAAPRSRPPQIIVRAPAELQPGTLAEVQRLVSEDRIIPAIKLVRESTGLGLKEAKDMVDAMR